MPLHLISLPVAFAVLLFVDRGLWFFYDEWDFLAGQGEGGRPLDLFAPHNEHWSTIPILIFRALYTAVGLHTYIPYLVVLLLAHVVLAHLLFRIMIRTHVDPWIALALTTVFLFLGAGAEDLTWAFQMAWILTLVIGLSGLILVDHDEPGITRDIAYWPVAVLSLMCSGIAVPLVTVAALIALVRRGWHAAVRVASVPAIVFATWFGLVGHVGYDTTRPTKSELLQVPQYVWTGLTTAVDNTLGWAGSGAVIILALAVFVELRGPAAWRNHAIAVGMAAGAVLFFAITGLGRIALGVNESASSRYAYVAIALLLPSSGWALGALARRLQGGRPLVAALSVIITLNGLGVLVASADGAASLRDADKYQLLAAAHLIVSGAPLLATDSTKPDPVIAPQLTLGELRSMIDDGAVPLNTSVPEDAVLRAALQLQVAVAPDLPSAPSGAPTIAGSQGFSLQPDGACKSVIAYSGSSTLTITFPASGWIAITPDENGSLGVTLAAAGNPSLVTAPRIFTVVAAQTAYLRLTTAGSAAVLTLPVGPSVLCGAT